MDLEKMKIKDQIEKIVRMQNNIDNILLEKALFFSKKAHQGQLRESGISYWEHPVDVACILASMKMDAPTYEIYLRRYRT